MSVHDKWVYPAVKHLLGIPQNEPIFIFRAQDKFSAGAITAYKATVEGDPTCEPTWRARVGSDISDFRNFQRDNPEKVKVPD